MGATPGAAQELRNMIGREGAIGLIIGLACGLGAKPVQAPAKPRDPEGGVSARD